MSKFGWDLPPGGYPPLFEDKCYCDRCDRYVHEDDFDEHFCLCKECAMPQRKIKDLRDEIVRQLDGGITYGELDFDCLRAILACVMCCSWNESLHQKVLELCVACGDELEDRD